MRTAPWLLIVSSIAIVTCGQAVDRAENLGVAASAALACVDDVTLVDPDPVGPFSDTGDDFGRTIAALGGDVLVGSIGYSVPGVQSTGKVDLFDGATGAHIRTFTNPVDGLGAFFGWDIAQIDADRFVVLARNGDYNGDGISEGVAYVFDRVGTILVVTTGQGGAGSLGDSIAADGTRVFIGSTATVAGHPFSGIVTEYDASTGARIRTFFNPIPGDSDGFGTEIDVSPEYLFISAPRPTNTIFTAPGRVSVFNRATGQHVQTIVNSGSEVSDSFGAGIVALGDHVLVSADYENHPGLPTGARVPRILLFDAPTGVLLQAPAPQLAKPRGDALAARDGLYYAGARGSSFPPGGSGIDGAGAVVVYDTAGNYRYTVHAPVPTTQELFGYALAAGPSRMYVGAPNRSQGGVSRVGAAYVIGSNRPPISTGASVTMTENRIGNQKKMIVPQAVDPNNDALTFTVTIPPVRGVVVFTNGAFVYTPDVSYVGPDSFKFVSNDGCHDSNEVQVTISIQLEQAPQAFGQVAMTNEDVDLPLTLTGTDQNGDAITFAIVNSPASGTLSGTPPSVTYSPNANFNGSDSFTFKTNDLQLDSSSATVFLTVNPVNDRPDGATDVAAVVEDVPLLVAAPGLLSNDTDIEGTALTAVLMAGPSNGTLNLSASGSYTYTPAANFNGSDLFTYGARDGQLTSLATTVSISISAVNDAPVANPDSYSVDEDTALVRNIAQGVLANDSDVDSGSLSVVQVSGPANGVLSLDPTGAFSYTPASQYSGFDSFSYEVTDGLLESETTTVTLTVNLVNDPPLVGGDAYSGSEDTNLVVPQASGVLSNDSDIDSATLTAVLAADPANGSVTLNGDGSFTYTPNANFFGTDSFTYISSDGPGGSSGVVTLAIAGVNDAPAANPDSYSTSEDLPLVAVTASGVLANDVDVDSTMSAVLVTGPLHGTISLGANGSFLYTPTANYAGADSFTYNATDGVLDSAATASISVLPVNDGPLAVDDHYSVTEDTALVATNADGLLANDLDIDAGPLAAAIVDDPPYEVLALAPDGTFTYTPAADFAGIDLFTYRVSDGVSTSNPAIVYLTVGAVNDAPPVPAAIGPDGGEVVHRGAFVFAWEPSVDADGDGVTYQIEVFADGAVVYEATTQATALALADDAQVPSGALTWHLEALDPSGASNGFSAAAEFVLAGGGGGGCSCDVVGPATRTSASTITFTILSLLLFARRRR